MRPTRRSYGTTSIAVCPSSRKARSSGRLAQAGRGVLAHRVSALQEWRDSGGRGPRRNDAAASKNAESRRIRHTQLEARHETAIPQRALAFAFVSLSRRLLFLCRLTDLLQIGDVSAPSVGVTSLIPTGVHLGSP
jgi:hypothetical protein